MPKSVCLFEFLNLSRDPVPLIRLGGDRGAVAPSRENHCQLHHHMLRLCHGIYRLQDLR
jgi:hypothetical protein